MSKIGRTEKYRGFSIAKIGILFNIQVSKASCVVMEGTSSVFCFKESPRCHKNEYGDYIPLIIGIITPIIKKVKMGVDELICFDRLWETMKKRSMTTYQLREKCGIDSKTVRRLKANDNMETKTLNKLCVALNCKLEDIAEYIEE